MGRRGDGWCEARTCLLQLPGHPVSWYGKGECPRCQLEALLTAQARDELRRELHGVNMNHLFITGKVEGAPVVKKAGEQVRVNFRIENTREEGGKEHKLWVDVVWYAPAGMDVREILRAGSSVAVRGSLASIPKGKGFTLAIKAQTVEVV